MKYIKPVCECGNKLEILETVTSFRKLDIDESGKIEDYDVETDEFSCKLELVCNNTECNKKFGLVADNNGRIWKDSDFIKAMCELKDDNKTDEE